MGRQNSFSLRLSARIDELIEGHLSRNQPRELFIPGLDDVQANGKTVGEGNIFDADGYDPDYMSPTRVKNFKAPHEKGEGTIQGNVGVF